MKVEPALREFKYNGMVLQDPDPAQTPEEVKAFYANIYPELNNAEIETERNGAKTVHVFRKAVGTKGADIAKLRGNAITAAQVEAARPLAMACLALAEARLLDYFDEEVELGEAIRAPSELLAPLP